MRGLPEEYQNIYQGSQWGAPEGDYTPPLHEAFSAMAKKYKIAKRIPPALYSDILSENDQVIVMLEHIDYLLKLEGKRSPYGYAAYSISKLDTPLSEIKDELQKLKGVGKVTEGIILEILETGDSSYYRKLR